MTAATSPDICVADQAPQRRQHARKNLGTGSRSHRPRSALVAGIPAAASAAPVTGPEDFTIVVTGNRPQLFTAEGTLNATGTAVPVIMNGVNGGVDEIQLPAVPSRSPCKTPSAPPAAAVP